MADELFLVGQKPLHHHVFQIVALDDAVAGEGFVHDLAQIGRLGLNGGARPCALSGYI